VIRDEDSEKVVKEEDSEMVVKEDSECDYTGGQKGRDERGGG
jgi:hypothetical protein